MEENGRRRVPGTLPPKAVSRCLGIQRTKLYSQLRAGLIPHVEREFTGESYEIFTWWVVERMCFETPEQLLPYLPEDVLR